MKKGSFNFLGKKDQSLFGTNVEFKEMGKRDNHTDKNVQSYRSDIRLKCSSRDLCTCHGARRAHARARQGSARSIITLFKDTENIYFKQLWVSTCF